MLIENETLPAGSTLSQATPAVSRGDENREAMFRSQAPPRAWFEIASLSRHLLTGGVAARSQVDETSDPTLVTKNFDFRTTASREGPTVPRLDEWAYGSRAKAEKPGVS